MQVGGSGKDAGRPQHASRRPGGGGDALTAPARPRLPAHPQPGEPQQDPPRQRPQLPSQGMGQGSAPRPQGTPWGCTASPAPTAQGFSATAPLPPLRSAGTQHRALRLTAVCRQCHSFLPRAARPRAQHRQPGPRQRSPPTLPAAALQLPRGRQLSMSLGQRWEKQSMGCGSPVLRAQTGRMDPLAEPGPAPQPAAQPGSPTRTGLCASSPWCVEAARPTATLLP